MPIPVELEELESAIKTLQKQLVTLKTASKDIVVVRNKLALALQEEEENQRQLVADLRDVLDAEVVEMWTYEETRIEMELSQDRLLEGRMVIAQHEQKLKAVHDEIPTVEHLLRKARAERAEWGEVLTFPARR